MILFYAFWFEIEKESKKDSSILHLSPNPGKTEILLKHMQAIMMKFYANCKQTRHRSIFSNVPIQHATKLQQHNK